MQSTSTKKRNARVVRWMERGVSCEHWPCVPSLYYFCDFFLSMDAKSNSALDAACLTRCQWRPYQAVIGYIHVRIDQDTSIYRVIKQCQPGTSYLRYQKLLRQFPSTGMHCMLLSRKSRMHTTDRNVALFSSTPPATSWPILFQATLSLSN